MLISFFVGNTPNKKGQTRVGTNQRAANPFQAPIESWAQGERERERDKKKKKNKTTEIKLLLLGKPRKIGKRLSPKRLGRRILPEERRPRRCCIAGCGFGTWIQWGLRAKTFGPVVSFLFVVLCVFVLCLFNRWISPICFFLS